MSFGRDQEVEKVFLVKDLCLGHILLYIVTSKRRTVQEVSMMDYSVYLMPLENEKDYTKFDILEDKDHYVKESFKYNTPFKSIRFADMRAKEIKSPENCKNYDRVLLDSNSPDSNNVISLWAKSPTEDKDTPGEYLEWQYIATDWQKKNFLSVKKLYVVKSDFGYSEGAKSTLLALPDFTDLEKIRQELSDPNHGLH